MSAEFKLDRTRLELRFKAKSHNAAMAVAEQIKADCAPLVPKAEGDLKETASVTPTPDGAELAYNQVYAAYQYYGCWPDGTHQIKNSSPPRVTPGTTTQWIEHARREHQAEWDEVAQNAKEKM